MSGGYLGMDTDTDRMGQGGGYYAESRQQNDSVHGHLYAGHGRDIVNFLNEQELAGYSPAMQPRQVARYTSLTQQQGHPPAMSNGGQARPEGRLNELDLQGLGTRQHPPQTPFTNSHASRTPSERSSGHGPPPGSPYPAPQSQTPAPSFQNAAINSGHRSQSSTAGSQGFRRVGDLDSSPEGSESSQFAFRTPSERRSNSNLGWSAFEGQDDQRLMNRVVDKLLSSYSLQPGSITLLRQYVEFNAKVRGTELDDLCRGAFAMAAQLHLIDLAESQARHTLPAVTKMNEIIEKFTNEMSAKPFSMSSQQLLKIEEDPSKYGLQEAFETLSNKKAFESESGRQISSIICGFKEDNSLVGKKACSLSKFAVIAYKKYVSRTNVRLTQKILVKLCICRRFILELPGETLPSIAAAEASATAEASSSTPPLADGRSAAAKRRKLTASVITAASPLGFTRQGEGLILNEHGNEVDEPEQPYGLSFWETFDWWFGRLQIAMGKKPSAGDKWARCVQIVDLFVNTLIWSPSYISQIIKEDIERYPLEKGFEKNMDLLTPGAAVADGSGGTAVSRTPGPLVATTNPDAGGGWDDVLDKDM
ncbi:hypothetical protein FA13DRAFT_1795876 [Coprinellus micaceus]|uniref:Uncharacterized protein n=1 Tax=Coprinellus micaceus TaxID=71717 RepID=A0A4Y7SWM0_COPMI|nr:hypothetical protein FA13DRAFT_1795876 [Coprinellus micaceus]